MQQNMVLNDLFVLGDEHLHKDNSQDYWQSSQRESVFRKREDCFRGRPRTSSLSTLLIAFSVFTGVVLRGVVHFLLFAFVDAFVAFGSCARWLKEGEGSSIIVLMHWQYIWCPANH